MESDFDFKMPNCYSKVDDKSFFDLNDFTLSLTFELDKDCLESVTNEMMVIDKYLKSSDKGVKKYHKKINESEYAVLELNNQKKTLKYLFIHH